MDAVTQQNAALVEQAAAASQSMQDQAARLSAAVAVFKLEHGAAASFAAAPASASAPARKALPAARPAPVKPAAKPARAARSAPVESDWEEF
jgi:hypothetical protein